MKKIGVVACYGNYNYGSMLQSLATLLALDKLGFESEFIDYEKNYSLLEKVRFIPRLLNMYLMREKFRLLDKHLKIRKYPEIKEGDEIRKKAFERFGENFYKGRISKPYVGFKTLKKCEENYDAVLVGSDQLWFPAGLPTNFYNLMFVSNLKRKVSYSTSFGVTQIPFYQKRRTRQYLSRIDYLSVREESGQKIIEKLTGRKAELVLDPTLLLTSSEWEKAIPNNEVVKGDYIFCYLLGSNPEHRKAVLELAQNEGLEIYDMPHIDEFVPGDVEFCAKHLYDVDPAQFVNLIRHAKYICTDSFHCCVFSILHHKKFVAFDRYTDALMASRNSRISNLCNIAGLNERRFRGNILEEVLVESDYKLAEQKLEKVKISSMEYLINALSDI